MTSEWEELYRAALLETNWSKMDERIHAADSAISARLHELSIDHGGTPEEKDPGFIERAQRTSARGR